MYVAPDDHRWYSSPGGQTTVAFLGVVLLATVLALARSRQVSEWGPVVIVSMANAYVPLVQPYVGTAILWGGFALGSVACIAIVLLIGLFHTPTLHVISRIKPINRAALALLAVPWFRAKYFAGLRATAVGRLRSTGPSSDCGYVELPASFVHGGSQIEKRSATPANAIARLLMKTDAPSVLVQAPGGRGKTAMLRGIVAAVARSTDPAARIPLVLTVEQGPIELLVETALADYDLPQETVRGLLKAGTFLLILDGLTEGQTAAATIQTYLRGEPGKHSPVLASSRLSDAYKGAFRSAASSVAVEPLPLSAASLNAFIEHYAPGMSATRPAEIERLLEFCRVPGGDYLPILVRISLIIGSDASAAAVSSVTDLYQNALRRLLSDPSESVTDTAIDEAADLALRMWWDKRSRTTPFAHSDAQSKILLRRLLTAGVMIPASVNGPQSLHSEATSVGFFHDSVLYYLCARSLALKDDASVMALTITRHQEEASTTGTERPEVFEFFVHMFQQRSTLITQATADLARLQSLAGQHLSEAMIMDPLPAESRDLIRHQASDLSASALLTAAIALLSAPQKTDELFALYQSVIAANWRVVEQSSLERSAVA